MLTVLPKLSSLDVSKLYDIEQRMMQMFYVSVFLKTVEDWNAPEVADNLKMLSDSTVMLHELTELLRYKLDKIDFIDKPVEVGFDCPLDFHCTYTRDQILVALDFMKPSSLREGVKWLPEKQLCTMIIQSTANCSTGKARALLRKVLQPVSDISTTRNVAAKYCCLSENLKLTESLALLKHTHILVRLTTSVTPVHAL